MRQLCNEETPSDHLPHHSRAVYLNTGFVPASQAKLNIYDLGIVLGATLTEMTRTFRHQPFRAEDHIARLYRSLKYSGIAVPLSQEEMLAKTRELAAANCKLLRADQDLGIVHFVTPGENAIYAGSAASAGHRVVVVVTVSDYTTWKPTIGREAQCAGNRAVSGAHSGADSCLT